MVMFHDLSKVTRTRSENNMSFSKSMGMSHQLEIWQLGVMDHKKPKDEVNQCDQGQVRVKHVSLGGHGDVPRT